MSALRLKLPRQAQKALMKAILLLDLQVIQPIGQMARGAREADCHQPAAIRQPGDQFQHTAPAAYLDILGNDKIGFLVLELDLIQDGLAGIGLGGNAVFAPGILVPYHVAVAGLFGQDAVTVQRKHLAVLRVYQTHHIKDALQPP